MEIEEIKEYIESQQKIKEVEDLTWKITYDGFWEYELEGTSADGEEDYRQGQANNLEELFKKLKEDI